MALDAGRLSATMAAKIAATMNPAPNAAGIQSIQAGCLALAEAIIDELRDYGDVRVKPTDSGLQRTPNPNNASTATVGPVVDVVLSGAIE